MAVMSMKHYKKERQFKNTTRKTNHEKDISKSNPKRKMQRHKTRTQNVLKNDPNGILFR